MITTRLAALALVFVLVPASHAQDVAGFAKVSADEPLSVAMRAPGSWIARALREARAILPDAMDAELDIALEEMADDLGFPLADAEAWRGVGLDPDGVMTFSVGHPGGWLGFPQRLRAILPIHDGDLLAAYLAANHGDGSVEAREDGSRVGGSLAFRAVGKEMVLVGRDDVDDAGQMQNELHTTVDALGAEPTVSGTAVNRAVASRLGASAFVGLFLRPDAWTDEGAAVDPDEPRELVDSFLIAAGPRKLAAAVRPRAGTAIMGQLERGADPGTALGRLPRPAATLTISLADPLALFQAVTDADSSIDGLPFPLASLVEKLGAQLQAGSLGVAAYPGSGLSFPRWVAFATVRDQRAAIATLDEMLRDSGEDATPLDAPEGARLWHDPDDHVALGVSDGVVFLGDAVERIIATVRGESEGHEPSLHGDALVEFDIGLRELLGETAALAPAALSEGRLTGRIEVEDGVVVGTLERSGSSAVTTSWITEAIGWAAWASAMDRAGTPPASVIDRVRAETAQIHMAAIIFATKNGRVPTMEILLAPDELGNPYIEGGEAPIDPWGNPYRIRPLEGRLRFEVVSNGPDGLEATDDDIAYPVRR